MHLTDLEPKDVRPYLREERAELLSLLTTLTTDQWSLPTAAPGWDVKSVVLHLLDDDLGWLSRIRDQDRSGLLSIDDYGSFVQALAAKNQRWIDGTHGLRPRVIIGLLEWSGQQMDKWWATIDLTGVGDVVWAGGPVPEWFDIAQDLTERWVHQMQIREALNKIDGYSAKYLTVVLETFLWALPHQYRTPAPVETTVNLDVGIPNSFHLESINEAGRWELHVGHSPTAQASLTTTPDAAWRLLTGAPYSADLLKLDGDESLYAGLLNVRGIIV